ncbi:MAG: glutamine amidotransferase [Chloroflexi bacterium]|nr:glutamine amidotransferase [Chloroflexota bacterium]
MNVYGDRGNVFSLVRRCQWRGIEVEVLEAGLGDRLDPRAFDLAFFGGGQDHEQSAVGDDLVRLKAEPLREAVEAGAALLSICGGYQLLGRFFRTRTGEEIPGIGLFDAWTVAGQRRHIGNVVLRSSLGGEERTLVGFENHSGKTYLGPGCQPLGRVVVGAGNNGEDGAEGGVYRNAFGCYLHGPLLPKNPWFADHLIRCALQRRYGPEASLPALDDRLEELAHAAIAQRAQKLRHQRSGAW